MLQNNETIVCKKIIFSIKKIFFQVHKWFGILNFEIHYVSNREFNMTAPQITSSRIFIQKIHKINVKYCWGFTRFYDKVFQIFENLQEILVIHCQILSIKI